MYFIGHPAVNREGEQRCARVCARHLTSMNKSGNKEEGLQLGRE